MTDLGKIDDAIAKLTPAERDAVQGRFSFSDPIEQEEGEDNLHALGIWQVATRGRREPLTEFGLQVRKRLQGMATAA